MTAMKRFRVFPESDDEVSPPCPPCQAAGASQAKRLRGPTQSSPGGNDAPRLVVPGLVAPVENTPGSASNSATGPVAIPATSKQWWEAVLHFDDCPMTRPALGTNGFPIVLHTIFSGLGSPRQVLRDLGYHVVETSMAEIKPYVREWLKANNLWTDGCFFTDVHPLTTHGAGHCVVHGDTCEIPAGDVDLFVAGFPCTPYSNQGQTFRSEEAIRNHKDFHKSQWTLDYIARVSPKMVVLENVPTFAGLAPNGAPGHLVRGVAPHSFCDEMCAKLRRLGYGVSWSYLALEPWIQASGGRIYVTAVKGEDPQAQEMADAVRKRIADIQAWRSGFHPQTWTEALMKNRSVDWMPGHALWPDKLSEDHVSSDAPELASDARARWQVEADDLRKLLERSGRPYHQSRLWSDPSHGAVREVPRYTGIPKPLTSRKREILDLGIAFAYHKEDINEVSQGATEKLIGTLLADVSQNPARRPWGNKLKRVTRDSRWYSYSEDRLLAPSELFRIYGWSGPDVSALTYAHAVDLLGDSMVLHTLGVVLDSTIVVCDGWASMKAARQSAQSRQ